MALGGGEGSAEGGEGLCRHPNPHPHQPGARELHIQVQMEVTSLCLRHEKHYISEKSKFSAEFANE